jgi:hypothetical protein
MIKKIAEMYERQNKQHQRVLYENRKLRRAIEKLGYGWNPKLYPEPKEKRI